MYALLASGGVCALVVVGLLVHRRSLARADERRGGVQPAAWRSSPWSVGARPQGPDSAPRRRLICGAGAMAPATYPKPPIRELIALFRGTRDTLGYYSPILVREICRRGKPADFSALRTSVYGPLTPDEIDPDGMEALERGYEIWRDEVVTREAVARGS